MKELLGQNYNQTGTWLDNLPVTNCLQQLCCSLLRLSLFYYVTALFIQVINIKKVSPKGYYYENKELQRGRLFRCWSSPSESAVSWPVWEPLLPSPPPKKKHTQNPVLLDILSGEPQPWQTTGLQKRLDCFCFFFLYLPPTFSPCKAVLTMYRPNNALMFRLFSLSAWAKYFLDSSRFSSPPCVYFTCVRRYKTRPISCAERQLKQWQHGIWISNTWQPFVNISFHEPMFPMTLSARRCLSVLQRSTIHRELTFIPQFAPMLDDRHPKRVPTSAYCSQYKWLWGFVIISSSRQNAAFP